MKWYETASRQSGVERAQITHMLHRRIWGHVFMVSSMLFVVCMTTYFYNVLTR